MRRGMICAALAALLLGLAGCGGGQAADGAAGPSWDSLTVERSMELHYAEQFSVEYLTDGYKKIVIGDEQYLTVPENAPVPAGLPDGMTVLQQPLDHIYLVATSAMDLLRELDALDAVALSGTEADNWYIDEARQAMENGSMLYAGKYSAPDYELILEEGCDLAVESTMIYHTPEVMEQLERLGVPVLVERSSYESHPLGRMEWLRLYAALLDREEQAETYFDAMLQTLAPILEQPGTGKTAAFFYITSSGAVNVRRPGDYVAKAIALAGGVYALNDLPFEESALSTVNMQMEAFYQSVRDADVLIYNSAIDGGLQTLDELLEKSPVLRDCRAVRQGNVWCTEKNLFQQSLGLGALITDLHTVFTQEQPDERALTYLRRLS
ncbi:MAG: ABC transporter substrate-binding protein [Agathobaculum sp.]|uniref:ABC transporter substrate-binding protein n=1 Tax=Agathobaculum sp. TaxID=2048138 RepID=UPI003D8D38AD